MRPNKGQWHDSVEFKINIPGGHMYLEKTGFTYDFNNLGEVSSHDHKLGDDDEHQLEGHAVKTTFLGANPNPVFQAQKQSTFYENYIIGSDQSKWVSFAYAYNEVDYIELYNNIDLMLYEKNATLKYDVIVHPGGDANEFKVKYEGQNKIWIENGELKVLTSLGQITEGVPVAFQNIDGKKVKVPCQYSLNGNEMSFEFPEGYDSNYELIIDPDLLFSTFTGSSADNWGMTACPDVNKNLIAAGIVFGSGYPTTTGAYSGSFNGGQVDIGLTKFNTLGTGIVYSTYLGGSGSETPHSLIVNDQNELYIMGATSSTNFPLGSSPYQSSHQGGTSLNIDGIDFSGGTDIYVTKLSANGATLLGGTYLGGSSTDGISDPGSGGLSNIAFNYGDQLRGEIMVDNNGSVYVSSTSNSANFPIQGGFDTSLNGGQDGIVAKFDTNLSNLLWSTFVGGGGMESGNSVQVATNGDIYVAGGTTSSDFPNTAGQLNGSFQGGTTDGYIIKFPAPAYNNPVSTYLGTADYDQAYFVQIDPDDFIYVYGQTKGAYPVSAGRYNNPNSGQFIHKLSADLTTSEWSSVFGAGTGNEEISPTAFLVSDCYEIYISGWGGSINVSYSNAVNSTTNGFPVTPDAFQSSTSGSNFYLALYTKDMVDLKYATFMGSLNGSTDHVDGGTSRFDKQGGVYHAVCAACGGNTNGFPTTPGVFSENNNSSNCNMAAFLFELAKIDATLGTGTPVICIPDPVIFDNASQNGNSYFWDFGDGVGTSTAFEPTYYYSDPGDYTVMLIVSDTSGCFTPDTAYVNVTIQLLEAEAGTLTDTICPGESVQLFAIGGDSYVWGPGGVLNDSTIAEPIATIWEETTFTVTVNSECGQSVVDVTVFVFGASAESGLDTAICVGGSAQLYAAGGDSYSWTPPGSLDDPNISNPLATPLITTYYIVEIITPEGCQIYDTTNVVVDQDLPYPNLIDEVSICQGSSIQIAAGGATDYLWSPDYNISSTTIYNPYVNPTVDTSYAVAFTNACGTTHDTVDVYVINVVGLINPDTTICPGGTAVLMAEGGETYSWYPSGTLSDPQAPITNARPGVDTEYSCVITDQYGCSTTLYTNVYLYPLPTITVSPDVYGIVGDSYEISAQGSGDITWTPPDYVSCTTCPTTMVSPPGPFTYTAIVTDMNGCTNSDDINIYFDPLIYVPNAFTPNGDGFNNGFQAIASNILDFEMLIFNRWGEVIYTMDDVNDVWYGTYNNNLVLDDVYVWQIRYTDLNEDGHILRGHVTVLK